MVWDLTLQSPVAAVDLAQQGCRRGTRSSNRAEGHAAVRPAGGLLTAWGRFLRFSPSFSPDAAYVELPESILDVDGQAALALGAIDPPGELRFEHAGGWSLTDVLNSTSGQLMLLSARVCEAMMPFSGWRPLPAVIVAADGAERRDFVVLCVEGRSGPIDDALSERVTLPPPVPGAPGGPGLRGLYFEPDTWDGSDVFAPEGSTLTFVTQDVGGAIERLKPTNALIEQLSEIEQML